MPNLREQTFTVASDGSIRKGSMQSKCAHSVSSKHCPEQLPMGMGTMQAIAYLNDKINKLEKGSVSGIDVVEENGYATIRLLTSSGDIVSQTTIAISPSITLYEQQGELTLAQLMLLGLRSTTTLIYDDHVYRLSKVDALGSSYTTSVTDSQGRVVYVGAIDVDTTTGAYVVRALLDERIEEIRQDLRTLHRTKVSAEAELNSSVENNFTLNLLTD